MYHGTLLLIERALGIGRSQPTGPPLLGWARTTALVLFGWILFRSASIEYALGFMEALVRPAMALPVDVALAITPQAMIALFIGAGSVLTPRTWVTGVRLENPSTLPIRLLRLAMIVVVLPASLVVVMAGAYSPFLYFQF